MSNKQIYDKEGTTHFQYTFKVKRKTEWHVFFAQGFISISDVFGITKIKINFPEEDHWVYEERETTPSNGGYCRGAEIKTKDFTLTVDVREYLDYDDPDFNSEFDEAGSPEGYLELDTKIGITTISIPYKFALSIIKFMSGSTDLEGVCGVIKLK